MKQFIAALFIVSGFIACKNESKGPEKQVRVTEQTSIVSIANPAEDSTAIRKVITEFYNWYNENYAKLQDYHLYSSIRKKDAPPYKINWYEVEKYQQFIRTAVPQLGEEFLINQKRFFQECDSAFKVDTGDDIPYGFDYDWYTNSQEDAQYLVDQINRGTPWIITRAGNYITVDVRGGVDINGKKGEGSFITITMKNENGQWKIARIGSDY